MAHALEADRDDFRARLDALDVSLFKDIKSQTKKGDRASLLALQSAAAERYGTFVYLEIGSHLGGSLQAFVRDDRVSRIISIDLRPEFTPDDRGKDIPYQGNSTQRMLDLLGAIPAVDLTKIHTIDADTRSLGPGDVPERPELCFIDGEHTFESCLADARFCRSVVTPGGVIAFHDSPIIYPAIGAFLKELRADGVAFTAYPVPDVVFVIELEGARLYETAAMRRLIRHEVNTLPALATMLAARASGGDRPLRRALLAVWLSPLGVAQKKLKRWWRREVGRRRKALSKGLKRRRRRAKKIMDKRVRRLTR